MKKHLLKVIGILAISASAYAIAPDLVGPPITEGTATASSTEVRVTANVVTGVAVNEASPIDFGNLVRGKGIYGTKEVINENTPGLLTFRADKEPGGTTVRNEVVAYLDTNMINLDWRNNNGSSGDGDNIVLRKVRIEGLGVGSAKATSIPLVNGQGKKLLHAWFYAYDKNTNLQDNGAYEEDPEAGNLGAKQKLGSYLGTVKVTANVK